MKIGDLLVQSAIVEHGELAWYGITYAPLHDRESLGVLPDDLMTGTLGIAVVLADLFDVTREQRYRETALAALEGATKRITGTEITGGLVGRAALEYTLARCGTLLDTQLTIPQTPAPSTTLVPDPYDLVYGAAGILLASSTTTASWWNAIVDACDTQPSPRPYPVSAHRRLASLPGRGGVRALVARRLGRTDYDEPTRQRLCGASELALVSCGSRMAPMIVARARRCLPTSHGWSTERVLCTHETVIAARRHGLEAADESELLAAELCARVAHWSPLRAMRHDLSALWGAPAVAACLLRHIDPKRRESIRVFG